MDNNIMEYVMKHNKSKDRELKYDFMPPLIEIIEKPTQKAGTFIIFGIFTLLVSTIIWACLSKIDVVVTARGSVQPIGNLNTVSSFSAGTVETINVIEGQYIEKGAELITLNTDALELDKDQLSKRKSELEVQQELYLKIRDGEGVEAVLSDEYEPDWKSSVEAIINTDASYRNTLQNLEKEKSVADINQQIAQLQLEELKKSGTSGQVESQELLILQYELAVEEADIKLSDAQAQYQIQLNSKLTEIAQTLEEIHLQLEKAGIQNSYQKIVSPVNGYINSIDVNTLGAAVTSGQKLVTIVPADTPVELAGYVKNMDIADIKVGMESAVKFDAFPYSKFGTVKGKVKYISPSAFTSEQLGSVYLIKLDLENLNPEINIISGLSGTVEIKTRKRTIMDYFLEPITDGLQNSLKER